MSNSLARGYNFFAYGYWCGACHNASDVQVKNKRIQYARIKNENDSFLLDIYLLWSVFVVFSGGCTGEALYVVLGASRCDWHLLLWVTLPTL